MAPAHITPRPPLVRFVVGIVVGVILGVSAAYLDANSTTDTLGRALMILFNMGSVWAAAAIAVGAWAGRRRLAAVAGAATLLAGVVAYYSVGIVAGDRADVGLAASAGTMRWWLLAAAIAGPLLGLAGFASRGRGSGALLAGWVAPALVLGEIVVRMRPSSREIRYDPARFWAIATVPLWRWWPQ